MKPAFYIHHTAIKAGGIFTYSVGVLKLLLGSDEIEKLYLVYSDDQKEYLETLVNNEKVIPVRINRSSKIVKIRLMLSYLFYDLWFNYSGYLEKGGDKLSFLRKLASLLNPYKKVEKSGADLFHVPMQYSPVYDFGLPVIITMHDVQELHFPQFFDSKERMHRAINVKKAIDRADHIFVSFDHVKKDIRKFFETDDNRVTVAPPPIGENWFSENEFTSAPELRDKYGIKGKFLLYPAATWPHKNHKSLIEAFSKIDNMELQLVCTGNKTDYHRELINFAMEKGSGERLIFAGMVPEKDLIGLYKSAALVVIPTLYEAGSGPLYEAFRYGAPVICSNVTSLPDTVGDARFMFDPLDIAEIKEKIVAGLTDEEFRKENLENSEKRLKYFKELNYISNFLEGYQKAK